MSEETCWRIAAWLAGVSCLIHVIVFIGDLVQLLKKGKWDKDED